MSAVRHPVSTAAEAVKLRDAGWSLGQIRRILADRGTHPLPSVNTIWTWTVRGAADRANAHKRTADRSRRAAHASFRYPGQRSPEWKVERARALAAAGLGHRAIAVVMSHDFPEVPVTLHQIYRALKEGVVPPPWREAA